MKGGEFPSRSWNAQELASVLAIDLDGTALGKNGLASPAVKDALWWAARRGVTLVIATTQAPASTRTDWEHLQLLPGPAICHWGARLSNC